jgi:hypothetical protein
MISANAMAMNRDPADLFCNSLRMLLAPNRRIERCPRIIGTRCTLTVSAKAAMQQGVFGGLWINRPAHTIHMCQLVN